MKSLIEIINNTDYDFFFLVVDHFLNIQIPEVNNLYTIFVPNLATKNSGYLLSQPDVQKYIKEITSKSGHKAAIIPFKPSAKIDRICNNNQWIQISNPTKLNRYFEDKIKFFEMCRANNLPIVPGKIDALSKSSFQEAQAVLGDKLVIQTHFGWAGNSSYVCDNYNKIVTQIPQETVVKYSKYVSGYSLINNCCLYKNKLIQSPVGLQYTGIKELTVNPLATVGRQWPSGVPRVVSNQVDKVTRDFSKVLVQDNYKGFFGLDFIVSNNKVYLLECNPRLTASFNLYTQMEMRAKLNPLFLFHIASFIGINEKVKLQQNRFSNQKLIGSEITLKNKDGATVKKYNDFVRFSDSYDPISISSEIISRLK